jgi:hypothetical protein
MLSMFIALGIQDAMRMHHIVICGLPRSTVFFHIISQTARFKKKTVTGHKMCVLISPQLFSETFLILRRNKRDMIKMCWPSCKIILFILVNDQLDALFLNVFISRLYMFRVTSAHHQEGQIVLIN